MFNEKGRFVRVTIPKKEKKSTEKDENKCMEHILKRLLKEPVEAKVMWKELEPYRDIRKFVLQDLLSWRIIRIIKIPVSLRDKKIMYFLNIHSDFLTDPDTRYYFPEIAAAIQNLRKNKQHV